MSCCHGYALTLDGAHETAFTIDASAITFGRGALLEAGDHVRTLGCERVALFTDPDLAKLSHVAFVAESIREAGVDVTVYDEVHVEPTDASFKEAAAFARDAKVDGYVSVGGGSTIDTAKAANLYASYPAPLGPMIAWIAPSATSSETSSSAVKPA